MRLLTLIIASIIFFCSCQKDRDTVAPIITILTPTDLSTFRVLDQVPIEARIEDNENIKSITVSLFNQSTRTQAGGAVVVQPNQSVYILDLSYTISDSLLITGDYYFKITANDGENEISAFKTIRVTGIPRRRLGVLASVDHSGTTVFKYITDGGSIENLSLSSSPVHSIAIDNYFQNLWVVSNGSADLKRFELNEDRDDNISVGNPNQISELFTFQRIAFQTCYVSLKDGRLIGYNRNGGRSFSYNSNLNQYVTNFSVSDDVILIGETIAGSPNYRVRGVSRVAAAEYFNFSTNKEPVGFGFKDDNESYLFFNEGNSFKVSQLSPKTGFNSEVYQRSNINLKEVIQMDIENFILIADDQLLQFNYRTNFLDVIKFSSAPIFASYDDLNNQIIIGTGNELSYFDINSRGFIRTEILPGQISGLAIRFNK